MDTEVQRRMDKMVEEEVKRQNELAMKQDPHMRKILLADEKKEKEKKENHA